MIKLTIDQEIEILENLGSYIANGSSRVVYDYDNDYIVKVALDKKGQYQNNVEVKNYRNYGDTYLARIQSYGKYIVVMERVDELDYCTVEDIWEAGDYDEFVDWNTDQNGNYYYEGVDEDLFYKVQKTVDALEQWNGRTEDNYQIGTVGGRIVAFDYGFETGSFDKCVSNLGDQCYSVLESVGLAVLDILKGEREFDDILETYGLVKDRW